MSLRTIRHGGILLALLLLGAVSALHADACQGFEFSDADPVSGNAAVSIQQLEVNTPDDGSGPATVTVYYQVSTSGSGEVPPLKARIQIDVRGLEVDDGAPVFQEECRETATFTPEGASQDFQETFTLLPPSGVDPEGLESGFAGTYGATVEIAHSGAAGFLRDADPGDNRDQLDDGFGSLVVAEDTEAQGSVGAPTTVRASLRNNGPRPTGTLRLVWTADLETAEEEAPGLGAQGEDGDTCEVEHAFTRGGASTQLQIFARDTNMLLHTVIFLLEPGGGGPGGGGPGGGGPGGGGPGGGGPGGGGPGGGTPPPPPPGTGAPDYRVRDVTVSTQDPRSGIFLLKAEIENIGGTATEAAPVDWHLDHFQATNTETGSVQGNATLVSRLGSVPPIPAGQTAFAVAEVNLSAEEDPEARADEASGSFTVSLPGDDDDDNSVSYAVLLAGDPGAGVQPPRFAPGRKLLTIVPALAAFQDSLLGVTLEVRNVGGPAKQVTWDWGLEDLQPDSNTPNQQHVVSNVGENQVLTGDRAYNVPRGMHPRAGEDPVVFTGSARITAFYDDENGEEQVVNQNLPVLIVFEEPYPRVDLGITIGILQGEDGGEGLEEFTAREGEEVQFGLKVKNFGDIPIGGNVNLDVELLVDGTPIEFEEGEFSGEIPVGGSVLFVGGRRTFSCSELGQKSVEARIVWEDFEDEDGEGDADGGDAGDAGEATVGPDGVITLPEVTITAPSGPDANPWNDEAGALLNVEDHDESCDPPVEVEIGDAVIECTGEDCAENPPVEVEIGDAVIECTGEDC